MRLMHGHHARPAGIVTAAVTAATFAVFGLVAPAASAASGGGSATHLSLSAAVQKQLRSRYAGYRKLPVADIALPKGKGAVGARAASGTDWAVLTFAPAASAPLAVRVEFQDGAGEALFTKPAGKSWSVVSLGGQPLGCDTKVPAAVRRLWKFGSCPKRISSRKAAAPSKTAVPRAGTTPAKLITPRVTHRTSAAPLASASAAPAATPAASTGTTASIASIALGEVGVADTPADHSFAIESEDCNPFTAIENSSAPDSGCGTDPSFGILNHAEYWCSDFAKWVWTQGGVTSDLSTITPLSSSFYTWGLAHGESMPVNGGTPQVGDAIVLYPSGTSGTAALEDDGAHVGIITAVNSNGTINVANGDFITSNSSNIEVLETTNQTPSAYASSSEGSGEEYVFVSPQLPTGASLESSSVTMYGQQLQVFGRTSAGAVESDVWSPGTGKWSTFQSIGGNLTDDPTALEYDTTNYGAQMEVYGMSGGSVVSAVYTESTGKWSTWENIGGSIAGDPVAIQYGSQLQVWGREADGSVESIVYTPGKSWSAWDDIGGDIIGNPSVVNYGTQLEVYGTMADGTVESRVWTPSSNSWSAWENLGGTLAGNPDAVVFGTQMQVWGREASGAAESDVYTPSTGKWSGWRSIGGSLTGDPAAVAYDTSNYGQQLEVYGQEAGGAVYSDVYTVSSGKWSGWENIGGTLADNPVPIQYGSQMQIWGREANDQTYSDVYTPGKTWTGWNSIGGDLEP